MLMKLPWCVLAYSSNAWHAACSKRTGARALCPRAIRIWQLRNTIVYGPQARPGQAPGAQAFILPWPMPIGPAPDPRPMPNAHARLSATKPQYLWA